MNADERVANARLLGRAETHLALAVERLHGLEDAARGGAFVIGTYDARREVEQLNARVAELTALVFPKDT